MAEVVGLTASVAGLIQLTGQVTVFASGYIGKVKRASEEIDNLINELTSLSNVLVKLGRLGDECASNSTELQKLDTPLRECNIKLKELRSKLERGMKGTWLRRACRSLKWPLEEAETVQFIAYIERCKSLFMVALSIDNFTISKSIEGQVLAIDKSMKDIQSKIHVVSETQSDEKISRDRTKRNEILDWLYPDDFDIKHIDISSRRQKGTGEWFLNSPEMQSWTVGSHSSRLLWGYGIPGAGKTFISSGVIDHLNGQAKSSEYGVAYVYFDYKERENQTPIRVLASLVKQIGYQIPYLPQKISTLHEEFQDKKKRPSLEDLIIVLLSMFASFKRVFIIFDALDECNQKGQRDKLLPLFHRLGEGGANVLITSRYYPEDIQASFKDVPKKEIIASGEDIRSYILQKLEENPRAKRLAEMGGCEDRIISELAELADGMFLLVHFHIEYLCGQTTVNQLLSALESFGSKDSGTEEHPLDPTYDRVLENIQQQPKKLAKLAIKTLSWIVKAQKALTVEEIQIAVSIDPKRRALDELDFPEKATLLEVCASLITIDDSNVIRLAHLTVQEYLLRSTALLSEMDHEIALACITYLSFDIFAEGLRSLSFMNTELIKHPFLEYVARHLVYHLEHCDEVRLMQPILEFLKRPNQIIFWFLASLYFNHNRRAWRLWGYLLCTPLHIAAYMGNSLVVQHLLDEGFKAADPDGCNQSAVHWAALTGHTAVLKVLFDYGAEASNYDNERYTALHHAAYYGYDEIARFLLDRGASVSALTDNKETPLHLAAHRSNEGVAKLLLDRGASVSAAKNDGVTPLHYAARNGNEEMVKLLLGYGASVSAAKNDGVTPLHYAARNGNEEMVKLLLGYGASVSATENGEETPLHLAVMMENEGVAKLLLDHGASSSAADNSGRTPLYLAASGESEEMFKLLLDRGASVSAATSWGETPLHCAARNGREEMVKLLLDRGASVSAVTEDGETPLYFAVRKGGDKVVKLLLDRGASVSVSVATDQGRTPLHYAAGNGSEEIFKLLLDLGANVSATDENGRTPLHYAAGNGSEEMVKLLLDLGANVSATDENGRTPLHYAAGNGSEEMVKLLLDLGANVSAATEDGETPLHYAAVNGREMVKLLLDRGASVSAATEDGKTPLHYAAEDGCVEVVKLLLDHGADIHARDKSWDIPRHRAF